MALFIGRAVMQVVVEIPVFAQDYLEAVEYMTSTNEWKSDSGFSSDGKCIDITFVGVEKVVTLANTPIDFNSDTECWGSGNDLTTVSEAFVEDKFNLSHGKTEQEFDAYIEEKRRLCEWFDIELRKSKRIRIENDE